MTGTPFHDGERAVQERTGERATALINGQNIRTVIPAAARLFVTQQRLLVTARQGANGDIWAGVMTGLAGFLSASDDHATLDIVVSAEDAARVEGGVLHELSDGEPLGLLLIELSTRRRLRINGAVASHGADSVQIAVAEAFALCPKYIQRRDVVDRTAAAIPIVLRTGAALDAEAIALIATADTFFVASAHPDGRLDASHRGGRAGFVQVRDEVLWIPDYVGNSMFNTLGNFALNPRAGLCFVDFAGDRQLRLTGHVEIQFDVTGADWPLTGGTARGWIFRPREWIMSSLQSSVGFAFVEASSFNP